MELVTPNLLTYWKESWKLVRTPSPAALAPQVSPWFPILTDIEQSSPALTASHWCNLCRNKSRISIFPLSSCQHLGGFAVCSHRDKMCHLSEVGNPDQALSLSSSPADRGATKNANWQLTYHCSIVFSNDENFQFLREGSNFGQGLRVQQE